MLDRSSLLFRFSAITLIIAMIGVWYAITPVAALAFNAPGAVDDAYTTAEDTPLHVAGPSVLSNDTGDNPLSIEVVGSVAHGSLAFNGDNSFDYSPNLNFNGTDSFTYTVGDGISTSTPATVTITVTPVNDVPTAQNQSLSVAENFSGAGTLIGTDIDGADTLTYGMTTEPTHGTVTLNPTTGQFTYVPTAGYLGADSFNWQVFDGTASSSEATVSISVVTAPTISINLVLINDNGGLASTTDFLLILDGSTTTGDASPAAIGAHTVSGSNLEHYIRTISGDCAADGTVTLAIEDAKHCTVTYDDHFEGGGALGSATMDAAKNGSEGFTGAVLGASTSTDATTTLPELPPGCTPLLTGFMRKNMTNSSDEVKKLQKFLNDTISTALPLNGEFNDETDAAVRSFQKMHAEQILSPWGIRNSTGFVYLTTQRWINLMSCSTLNIPLPKLVPFHGE